MSARRLAAVVIVACLWAAPAAAQVECVNVSDGTRICRGSGSPEGVVLGNTADIFLRVDGAAGTTIYRKVGDGTNTGWTPVSTATISGTIGALAKFTATDAVGNSICTESGTTITCVDTLAAAFVKSSSLTTGRCVQTSAAGLLVDSSGLLCAGSNLTSTATVQGASLIGTTNVRTPLLDPVSALTIEPAGNILLGAVGAAPLGFVDVRRALQTDTYVPKLAGWQGTYGGRWDIRRLFTNALDAEVFTANLAQAFASKLFISRSFGIIHSPFTCPAFSGTALLTVKDFPSNIGSRVFGSDGGSIRAMQFDRSGSSLTIGDCVGTVTLNMAFGGSGFCNIANGCTSGDAHQQWTFTRYPDGLGVPFAPDGGSLSASDVIAVDNIALDYGVEGTQFAVIDSWDGADNEYGSYFRTAHWIGSPTDGNFVMDCQIGNLKGLTGTAQESGLLCGTWATRTTTPVVQVSTAGANLFNINASIYSSAVKVIDISPTGTPHIAIGPVATGVPTACSSGVEGFWADPNCWRVGDLAANFIRFDGSELELKSNHATIDNDGITLAADTGFPATGGRSFNLGGFASMSAWSSGLTRGLYLNSVGTGSNVGTIRLDAQGALGLAGLSLEGYPAVADTIARLSATTITLTAASGVKVSAGLAVNGGTPSDAGIVIPASVPASTVTNLYNSGGNLFWAGNLIATPTSGGVFGSGTAGWIPAWSDATTLGDSQVQETVTTGSTGWALNRSGTDKYFVFQWRTASVPQWSLGQRETATASFFLYNNSLTANALTFALADSAATFAAGVTAASFVGPLTGNASTATALAANPVDCAANQFATSINASGTLGCAAIADADVPNTITVDLAATVTTNANLTGDVTSVGNATAIAAGVIVNADVNASAAIAWTKIDKTGSSLADLATRSAADLSSGELSNARVAQSNVTQHQAALSIAETQIPDGALFARVAAPETITGAWSFSGGGGEPIRTIGVGTTGVASVSYVSFYDSNASTRRGYIGDASSGDTDFYVHAETGSLRLHDSSATGLVLTAGSGVFAGNATAVGVFGATGTFSALTNTRVTFACAAGLLCDDADFLFTGGNTLASPIMNATTGFRVAGAGAAGTILRGNGTNYVVSQTTYPDIVGASNILYATAGNTVGSIATANSGVLVTSAGGVPSIAVDIPTAVTIGGAYVYRAGGTDVPVPDGGTGVSTLAANGVLYGAGASAVSVTAQGPANSVLTANAGAPSFSATPTVTSLTATSLLSTPSIITAAGPLGITPAAGQGVVVTTTGTQIKLAYDGSNYITFTTGATGIVTMDVVGAGAVLIVLDLLKGAGYVSQTTEGALNLTLGTADLRYLFVDEMHAKTFIADLEQALAGGQIITKSVAMIDEAFDCPNGGDARDLYVRDLPSAADMAVFEAGDVVKLRTFSRASGSLTIADCIGVVTGYTDHSTNQHWLFTRIVGANGGGMATDTRINPDSLALDFGVSGNGYYEVNAIDGIRGLNSPYAQVATFVTSPIGANTTVRGRFGNLRGVTGGRSVAVTSITRSGATATVTTTTAHSSATGARVVMAGAGEAEYNGIFVITSTGASTYTYTVSGTPATPATGTISASFDEFGLIAGSYAATDGRYIRFGDAVTEIHGADLTIWDGAAVAFRMVRNAGAPYFSMGAPAPTSFSSGTGCWQGDDSGTYKSRCGDPANVWQQWDGSAYKISDGANVRIQFNADGSGFLANSNIAWDTSGNLTVVGNAAIAGFTINTTSLYTGSKTAYNDANAGVHVGTDGIGIGNNVFRVSSAGVLLATQVDVTGAVTAESGSISGELAIGVAGAFKVGTATACDAGTGIRIDVNAICGVASGVMQFKLDAPTGKATAGAGVVTLDAGGITITAAASQLEPNAYKFAFGGTGKGGLYGLTGSGVPALYLSAYDDTGTVASVTHRASSAAAGSGTSAIVETAVNGSNAFVDISASSATGGTTLIRVTGKTSIAPAGGFVTAVNVLDVEGGMAVGAGFSGTSTAPANGAIIEGIVGIGTPSPLKPAHVLSTSAGAVTYPLLLTNQSSNASTAVGIQFNPTALTGVDNYIGEIVVTKLNAAGSYTSRMDLTVTDSSGALQTGISVLGGSANVGLNCKDPDNDLEIGGTGAGCNTGTGSYIAAGSTAFTANSSWSLKTSIVPVHVPDILARMRLVQPSTYTWKDGSGASFGLIAEDFYTVLGRGDGKHVNGQDVMMATWLGVNALTDVTLGHERRIADLHEQLGGLRVEVANLKAALENRR